MILRLSEVLDLPFRGRNKLLESANHRLCFTETSLNDAALTDFSDTMNFLLASHDPFPSFILDDNLNVLRANRSASRILSIVMDGVVPPQRATANMIDWIVEPNGLNTVLDNWQEIGIELVRRIHRRGEMSGRDQKNHLMLSKMVGALEGITKRSDVKKDNDFFLPIKVRKSGLALNFYSVVTKLGDPRDVTLQELSMETLCPADKETRQLLISLSKLSA